MAETTQTVLTSGFGQINWRDLLNGAVNAAIGAVLGFIYPWINAMGTNESYDLNWKVVGGLALAGFLQHILRKLFSPPVVVIPNPTEKQLDAVKSGEVKVDVKPVSNNNFPNNARL